MHVIKITTATTHRTTCIVLVLNEEFCVDERVSLEVVVEQRRDLVNARWWTIGVL
jgi:hypothetical protein